MLTLQQLRKLEGHLRVDDHDLPLEAVRPSGAVEVHGARAQDGHLEDADGRLPLLEGYVPAVDRAGDGRLEGLARQLGRALRDGVVPRAELELDRVADRRVHLVRDEGVLRAADDDGVDARRPCAADDADYHRDKLAYGTSKVWAQTV